MRLFTILGLLLVASCAVYPLQYSETRYGTVVCYARFVDGFKTYEEKVCFHKVTLHDAAELCAFYYPTAQDDTCYGSFVEEPCWEY